MGPEQQQHHGRPPEQDAAEQPRGTDHGVPTPHDALLGELQQHSAAPASHDDRTTKQEFSMLFKLAGPTIVQTASQQAMVFTDQIFLGHLGTEEMAAAALGNMYVAFLTFFLLGTATALDTLGSQAYGAQRRGVKGGISLVTWCFTSFAVLTLLCVPVTILMSLGYPVARTLLGQGPEISMLMEEFCAGLIPGIWPMMWSVVLMKYLQIQNIMAAPAILAAATFVLNIGSNFAFIAMLGFEGAALATSFSRMVQCGALCAMVLFFERTRASPRPPSRLARWLFQGVDGADALAPPSSRSAPAATTAPDSAGALTAGAVAAAGGAEDLAASGRQPQGRFGMVRSDSALTVKHRSSGGGTVDALAGYDEEAVVQLEEAAGPAVRTGRSVDGVVDVRVHDGDGGNSNSNAAPGGGGEGEGEGGSLLGGGVEGVKRRLLRQSTGARELATYLWAESKASVRPSLLWTYLKLGLPGGVMMACEQGSFDVTTAMAGHLGRPSIVAAHSAMINVIGLTFVSCPFAVGIAGSIRVGNLLGLHMPRTARKSGWLAVAIGGTFMAVCAVVLLATRDSIGRIFSNDAEVVAIIATIAPMGALFQVSDGVMGCAQGVLRGCGKQRLLMVYNIVGFWMCGVLLGYLLCFHAGLGVTGLWWGIASGDTTAAILNIVTLALVNWEREAHQAQTNLHEHDGSASAGGGGEAGKAPRGDGGDDGDGAPEGGERDGLLSQHPRSDSADPAPRDHHRLHLDAADPRGKQLENGSGSAATAQHVDSDGAGAEELYTRSTATEDRGVWAPRSPVTPSYPSSVSQVAAEERQEEGARWGGAGRSARDVESERTGLLVSGGSPAAPPTQASPGNGGPAPSLPRVFLAAVERGSGASALSAAPPSGAPAAAAAGGGRLKSALHFVDMW